MGTEHNLRKIDVREAAFLKVQLDGIFGAGHSQAIACRVATFSARSIPVRFRSEADCRVWCIRICYILGPTRLTRTQMCGVTRATDANSQYAPAHRT